MDQAFGVCRLSVVPVKNESDSLQVGQLLFGDAYHVLDRSKDAKRIFVRTDFDEMEGWINPNHHHAISQEYFEQIKQSDFKITLDLVSTLLYKKSPLPILLGSIVPISSAELFLMDEQFAFNGEAKPISLRRDAEFVCTMACKYLNAPEVEGGKSPFGICSNGLVNMVFKIAGYHLPWDIQKQSQSGKKVKDVASAKAGDVAFFKNQKGAVDHAGIIIDENKIIHTNGQVHIDYLNDEGILNADTKIYSHTLAGIRRIIA
ncbi:MAG TPA: hypothetical protein DGG95_11890 [Cytophagales bacterium]|jgi:gamma-D-glutamyl-L-lysine dipeptidyl-peptidase|nr:hypothetical protein [Cytophagales bacterium]